MRLSAFFHKIFSFTSVNLFNSHETRESLPFDKYKNQGSEQSGFPKDWDI